MPFFPQFFPTCTQIIAKNSNSWQKINSCKLLIALWLWFGICCSLRGYRWLKIPCPQGVKVRVLFRATLSHSHLRIHFEVTFQNTEVFPQFFPTCTQHITINCKTRIWSYVGKFLFYWGKSGENSYSFSFLSIHIRDKTRIQPKGIRIPWSCF